MAPTWRDSIEDVGDDTWGPGQPSITITSSGSSVILEKQQRLLRCRYKGDRILISGSRSITWPGVLMQSTLCIIKNAIALRYVKRIEWLSFHTHKRCFWESILLSFRLHDRFYIISYPPTCSDRAELTKSTGLNFGKWNPCSGLRPQMLVTFLEQTSNQGSKLTFLFTCKVLLVKFFPLAILSKSLRDMNHSNTQTFAFCEFVSVNFESSNLDNVFWNKNLAWENTKTSLSFTSGRKA